MEKATRVNELLLSCGKEYIGIIRLHKKIDEQKIYEKIKEFTGKITQLPPKRSAVKRQLRKREVYYLNILEIKYNNILFKVGSEAGFYVRKLAHDFGLSLGVNAHLSQLVRTKVGWFNDKNWHSLTELKDAYEFCKNGDESLLRKIILPFEKAASHVPKIWVLDSAIDSICHGAKLASPGISKLHSLINANEKVAIMSLKDELIGTGTSLMASDQILNDRDGIVVKVEKVFMPVNTYPKYKRIHS